MKGCFGILFLVIQVCLYGQHPVWRNYTINEGLPSNGVYAMLQDNRGYLWVGTSHGICRFNGYEFVRPVDTSGSAYSSIMEISTDRQGRVWFNRLTGRLYYIENDTVRSWKYNFLLDSFPAKPHYTLRFAVADDGTVWIGTWNYGLWTVSPDGKLQKKSPEIQNGHFIAQIGQSTLTGTTFSSPDDEALRLKAKRSREMFFLEDGTSQSLGFFPLDYEHATGNPGFWVWPLGEGWSVGMFIGTYYVLKGNKLVWSGLKLPHIKAIRALPDGSILAAVGGGEHQGLLRYRSVEDFQNDIFENLLPDKTLSRFLVDREGGWWAASNKSGLYYCKNPKLLVYDRSSGLPADEVMALATDGRSKIFAGLRQLDVVELDLKGKSAKLLPRSPMIEMTLLQYDTLTGRLWGSNNLCFFERNHWTNASLEGQVNPKIQIPVKKITPDRSGKCWWAASSANVFRIDPFSPIGNCARVKAFEGIRAFSISQDNNGVLWVPTMKGLLFWRDSQLLPPLITHPMLKQNSTQVDQLPEAAGGGQILSIAGKGILIRDKEGRFTRLSTDDGLSTNMILNMVIRSDGVAFGLSNAGLNILTYQGPGKWKIETLTVRHGLPSNQVNDVIFVGKDTWIGTDGGIVLYSGKPPPAPMPAPQLENFFVDNQKVDFTPGLSLPYDKNDISLHFLSLHFRAEGKIAYRYRLNNDTGYTYTFLPQVNLANLPPGAYRFEVQAQSEDGQWSDAAQWEFRIRPPWWQTWAFQSLFLALLAGGALRFYHNRIKRLREEAHEREKIRDLETAALRAQMNPHFIFNCLQSIQAFVSNNDREAASAYLARFAKLIRLALHSSVDGRHSLHDEIAMLENYLYLEQLRFGHKFDFEIEVSPELDQDDLFIPPLLIQPFVENAVIHGLAKRDSGGMLKLRFAPAGDQLEVSVTDNGKGLDDPGAETASASHKSVGMMLTQKRLALLQWQPETFRMETLYHPDGSVAGAMVRVLLPLGG